MHMPDDEEEQIKLSAEFEDELEKYLQQVEHKEKALNDLERSYGEKQEALALIQKRLAEEEVKVKSEIKELNVEYALRKLTNQETSDLDEISKKLQTRVKNLTTRKKNVLSETQNLKNLKTVIDNDASELQNAKETTPLPRYKSGRRGGRK